MEWETETTTKTTPPPKEDVKEDRVCSLALAPSPACGKRRPEKLAVAATPLALGRFGTRGTDARQLRQRRHNKRPLRAKAMPLCPEAQLGKHQQGQGDGTRGGPIPEP